MVPDVLPALPAEVEVAAYRIATEALLNVARHALATSAVIEVRCNGTLDVVVTDDGAGAAAWSPGVGLESMRERAAEVGGSFEAGPSRRGGRVSVSIPVVGVVTIRVVVADDHPIVRAGLTALLGSIPDFEVAGVAANGREAIREVLLTKPDVALLDLNMPELDGIAATRELARVAPRGRRARADHARGRRGRVRGHASRGARLPGQGSRAGRHRACDPVGRRRRGDLRAGRRAAGARVAPGTAPGRDAFPELTAREHEILDLLAAGLNNAAIANRIGVAPKTVANNVSSIFTKLQVADRAQAIVRARDAGLGQG